MNARKIFASLLMAAAFITGCDEPENLGTPKIDLSTEEITFDQTASSQSIELTATRDWAVETDADWVVVDPEAGEASSKAQKLTVSVLENTGMDRSADLKFTIGMVSKYLKVNQAGPGGSTEKLLIYFNDYDKEEATKTYGSGSSWPYLDQFEGWKNHSGTGSASVEYSFSGMSARANSTSNSNYSDYEGSGVNNMFFGSNAYLATKNIALGGATKLSLTFGTEKYSQDNGSVFKNSEFHIYLSQDAKKWVELKDYTFAGGTVEGRWNLASANFTVPAGTEKLSICIKVDVASSYRMDDLKLMISDTEGTVVDFSKAVEMDFTAGGSNDGGSDTPTIEQPTTLTELTIAQFKEKTVNTTDWYKLTGTITEIQKEDYGNFVIEDETGSVLIYGMTSKWVGSNDKSFSQIGLKVGDKVTLGTLRSEYNGTPQGGGNTYPAFYISHVAGDAPTVGLTHPLTSNVKWETNEDNKSYEAKITINEQTVSGFKLGTSSKIGTLTMTIPAGTKKVGFYAVGWSSANGVIELVAGDTVLTTVTADMNGGSAGNTNEYTYTSVSDEDYFEISLPDGLAASDLTVTVRTTSAGKRAIAWGVNAY